MGGLYKRTPIPVGSRDGLRPTPERVRETVFDWLTHLRGPLAERRFCDMFAGSGALGLEAASRGAQRVVSLEMNRESAAAIRALVQKLSAPVEVRAEDAFGFLRTTTEVFDVIFIDPPFAAGLQQKAAEAALARLAPDGILYLEAEAEIADELLDTLGLVALRRTRAGVVHALLAVRKESAP